MVKTEIHSFHPGGQLLQMGTHQVCISNYVRIRSQMSNLRTFGPHPAWRMIMSGPRDHFIYLFFLCCGNMKCQYHAKNPKNPVMQRNSCGQWARTIENVEIRHATLHWRNVGVNEHIHSLVSQKLLIKAVRSNHGRTVLLHNKNCHSRTHDR